MFNRFYILMLTAFLLSCGEDSPASEPVDVSQEILVYPEVVQGPSDSGPNVDLQIVEGPCSGEPDGAECDDDNECTVNDTCQGGFCQAGQKLDCGGQPGGCVSANCDPQVGCLESVAPDGSPCQSACYLEALCFGGECQPTAGTEVKCDEPVDPCVESISCSPDSGKCSLKVYKLACPDGSTCRAEQVEGSDYKLSCVPLFQTLCRPCNSNEDCLDALFLNEVQLCRSHGDAGSFCSADCSEHSCPNGYECAVVDGVNGEKHKQCTPSEGVVCDCLPEWAPLLLSTACKNTNDFGVCDGQRVCTTDGLTTCDAKVPSLEICDSLDNDCNGVVDDGSEEVCGPEGACCTAAGECTSLFQESCKQNNGTFMGPSVTCDESNCGGGLKGACCVGAELCESLDYPSCNSVQGIYKGDGYECGSVDCGKASATGSCCLFDGTCSVETLVSCLGLNGSYGGHGSLCEAEKCITQGACCLTAEVCTESTSQECQALTGTFNSGSLCASVTCKPNAGQGACCLDGGACTVFSQADCLTKSGTWFDGENCSNQCNQATESACCYLNGTCGMVAQSECPSDAVWQGQGTDCSDDPCGQMPTGACCVKDNCYEDFTEAQCKAFPGDYAGDGTSCKDCQ